MPRTGLIPRGCEQEHLLTRASRQYKHINDALMETQKQGQLVLLHGLGYLIIEANTFSTLDHFTTAMECSNSLPSHIELAKFYFQHFLSIPNGSPGRPSIKNVIDTHPTLSYYPETLRETLAIMIPAGISIPSAIKKIIEADPFRITKKGSHANINGNTVTPLELTHAFALRHGCFNQNVVQFLLNDRNPGLEINPLAIYKALRSANIYATLALTQYKDIVNAMQGNGINSINNVLRMNASDYKVFDSYCLWLKKMGEGLYRIRTSDNYGVEGHPRLSDFTRLNTTPVLS
ncbi:hypothetical protein AX16_009498 [Volvariella volvacea WC 439]|nr:hypothetical protein AX16_009498 [Volvariella volvacea WC 439]